MSNFIGSPKVAGDVIFAADVNDDRLDVVVNAGDYADDIGTVNAIEVSLDSQIVAYAAGLVVKVEVANTNTDNPTLEVNGLGAVDIIDQEGNPIGGNSLIAGGNYIFMHDGANFQLMNAIAKSTKVFIAGETITGNTLPKPVYFDPADSEVYIVDDGNSAKLDYFGFAISNGTNGNPINVQLSGVVKGFSGLTPGSLYYINGSNISLTAGSFGIPVGMAISATELLMSVPDSIAYVSQTAIYTDTSPASTAKTASFTIPIPKKAKLINFQVTIWASMTTSGNGSRNETYDVLYFSPQNIVGLCLLNAQQAYNSGLTPFIKTGNSPTNANIGSLPRDFNTMSNSLITDTPGSGSITRVNSITVNKNSVEINYTLNSNGASSNQTAIAVSPLIVLN